MLLIHSDWEIEISVGIRFIHENIMPPLGGYGTETVTEHSLTQYQLRLRVGISIPSPMSRNHRGK